MTVMLTVAVKPKDGLKPYILMGSDTLQIQGHPTFSEDGDVVSIEEVSRNENYQKKYHINNKLIGMTGRFNEDLTNLLINFLKENDTTIDKLSQIAHDFVKDYITNDISVEYQRVTVTIGSCDDSRPTVSYIEVDTRYLSETIIDICEVTEAGSFVPIFTGNRKNTPDLQVAFIERVQNNSINYNIRSVRNAAKEYLEKAALRYSETCNQNIVFKILR